MRQRHAVPERETAAALGGSRTRPTSLIQTDFDENLDDDDLTFNAVPLRPSPRPAPKRRAAADDDDRVEEPPWSKTTWAGALVLGFVLLYLIRLGHEISYNSAKSALTYAMTDQTIYRGALRCVDGAAPHAATVATPKRIVVLLAHVSLTDHEIYNQIESIANTAAGWSDRLIVGLRRSGRFQKRVDAIGRVLATRDGSPHKFQSLTVCEGATGEDAWRELWRSGTIPSVETNDEDARVVIFDGVARLRPGWDAWLERTHRYIKETSETPVEFAGTKFAGASLESAPRHLNTRDEEEDAREPSPAHRAMVAHGMAPHDIPGCAGFSPLPKVWNDFLAWYDDLREHELHRLYDDNDWRSQEAAIGDGDGAQYLMENPYALAQRAHAGWARFFAAFVRKNQYVSAHALDPAFVDAMGTATAKEVPERPYKKLGSALASTNARVDELRRRRSEG